VPAPAAPSTTWLTRAQAAAHADRARRLITSAHPDARRVATVTEAAIRQWVRRGRLRATGLDQDGHQLFALVDVARAELATRRGALRIVGIPWT
jgi:hypothetical protein